MESLLKYPAVKDVEGKVLDKIIFRQMRITQLTILIFKDNTACYIIGQSITEDPIIISPVYYNNGDVDVLYTDFGLELKDLDLLNKEVVENAKRCLLKQALTERASVIAEIEELEKKINELKSNYNIV